MNQRFLRISGLVSLLILSLGGAAHGQAVGTITGLIVDGATSRPVTGAQVSILGTGRGGLVNNDGRFVLLGVPAGEVSLRVDNIGYASQERIVTVAPGETVTVNFELRIEALGLDEIIVTGTAGGQRRRAIGNVVTSLDIATRLEVSQPATVQQMLSGQIPGANIRIGGGNVGSGGSIRIRGMSTMALGSEPLIYIDGIRVDGGQTSISTGRGDTNISRLNDIDPDEIERIEVIKGPAAATLYGTEATNGVIQIFTKRGGGGRATGGRHDATGRELAQRSGNQIPGQLGLHQRRSNQTEPCGRRSSERERPVPQRAHPGLWSTSERRAG